MKNSIDIEKITVTKMIDLYCLHNHENIETCDECRALKSYSSNKLDKCIYRNNKPACRKCPVHCYAPNQRDKIKEIMRFSGPRLILTNPILSLIHVLKMFKLKK